MRIALIHALKHSIAPIEASFARLWPDARLMNLLDDSLSADVARDGRLSAAMTERFLTLGRYAVSAGADAKAEGPACRSRVTGQWVTARNHRCGSSEEPKPRPRLMAPCTLCMGLFSIFLAG